MAQGKLISYVDPTPFRGLDSIASAVDFMYSGRNIGTSANTLLYSIALSTLLV